MPYYFVAPNDLKIDLRLFDKGNKYYFKEITLTIFQIAHLLRLPILALIEKITPVLETIFENDEEQINYLNKLRQSSIKQLQSKQKSRCFVTPFLCALFSSYFFLEKYKVNVECKLFIYYSSLA